MVLGVRIDDRGDDDDFSTSSRAQRFSFYLRSIIMHGRTGCFQNEKCIQERSCLFNYVRIHVSDASRGLFFARFV